MRIVVAYSTGVFLLFSVAPHCHLPIMSISIHLPAHTSHLFRPREGSPADATIQTDPPPLFNLPFFNLQPQFFTLGGLGINIFVHMLQTL